MLDGAPETNFWYKVFVDASEVMSVFNLLIDNWYFTLQHLKIHQMFSVIQIYLLLLLLMLIHASTGYSMHVNYVIFILKP